MSKEIKEIISDSIKAFSKGNLFDNAINLFSALGYKTERRDRLPDNSYVGFISHFPIAKERINPNKMCAEHWEKIELLFQLTQSEMTRQSFLFDIGKVDDTIIEAYLFFAIELKNDEYSRTQLSDFTRELNKVFPMPVMVLFKYGENLTLSVIKRRLHKKDESKDVLEKVTLIKGINIQKPHRAHIEISFELSFDELTKEYGVTNFVDLHKAWQKTLDIKELNKRFYEELFKWYLWAVKNVKFPQIRPQEDLISNEAHQNESVIRLLTRLLFCWFLKEKQQLVPESLFEKKNIAKILKDFNPDDKTSSVYYRAVLQNLFFATLSVPIKDRKYMPDSYKGKNKYYGNQYVFRYQDEFVNSSENLKLFGDIPFLNGGLFDSLDKRIDDENPTEIRLDGFSSFKEKQAFIPDFIFWGEYKGIDLTKEYDNAKKNNETVHGLFEILNAYKFTIEENTPIEEEIALDPDLLGRTFESLLAYYNPETKTNARKQTGSFYTPREIVNYMVDESLIAYLKQQSLPFERDLETNLRKVISYSENNMELSLTEKSKIIYAIEKLKVLDPACGSGAFPMGILHKLVWVLHKVDPENKEWFESLIGRLPEYTQQEMRKKLQGENWNYIRKLGLIQESIYGVDIQPIAIQIAKLRFFISLIVDQKIRDTPENNYGLLPLPNLDFKLVCANALIPTPQENGGGSLLFTDDFELKFTKATSKYFTVSLPKEKKKLTDEIRVLVKEKVAEKIRQIESFSSHSDDRFSKHIAAKNKNLIEKKQLDVRLWKSYDNMFKNETVGFFEIKYFFPEVKDGFDIVLGNPPYVQLQKEGGSLAIKYADLHFETYERTGDVYSLFYEKGIQLLASKGVLCYITSNKWMRANYGESTRRFFAEKTYPLLLIDCGSVQVFDTATVDTNILMLQNKPRANKYESKELFAVRLNKDFDLKEQSIDQYVQQNGYHISSINQNSWVVGEKDIFNIKENIELQGVKLNEKKYWGISINYGIKTGLNEAFIIPKDIKDILIQEDHKSIELLKPILRGKDISAWYPDFDDYWLIASHNGYKLNGEIIEQISIERYPSIKKWLLGNEPKLSLREDKGKSVFNLRDCAYWGDFLKPKIIYPNMTKYMPFTYDENDNFFCNDKAYILSGNHLKYLTCFFNSKLFKYCFADNFPELQGGTKELRKVFFDKIPVKQISLNQEQPFDRIVEYLVALHKYPLNNSNDEFMSIYFEQIANGLVYELYFKESFEQNNLAIHKYLYELPKLSSDTPIIELRKIFVKLYQQEHPVRQAVFSMMAIPQIQLIQNTVNI